MEKFRILATDFGPHPPEKWAMHTAEEIFDVSKTPAAKTIAARAVQLKIAEALQAHYADVQQIEQNGLNANAAAHLDSSLSADPHMDAMVKAVFDATRGSEWEAHYQHPDVVAEVRKVIAHHVVTAQHTERLWHANRNPDLAESTAYRARMGA